MRTRIQWEPEHSENQKQWEPENGGIRRRILDCNYRDTAIVQCKQTHFTKQMILSYRRLNGICLVRFLAIRDPCRPKLVNFDA